VAEGVRLLEEAWRFNRRPVELYWAPSLLSSRGEKLRERLQKAGVAARRVAAAELGRIADTETSQGLLAVFETPELRLSEHIRPPKRNVLLCENLSDPGNVGTLIRSALAFDFDLVALAGQCAEPFSPKVVRASVGAVFGIPVAVASRREIIEYAERERLMILGAALQAAEGFEPALTKLKDRPLMLAIGSEPEGLSPDLLHAAQKLVRIEHSRSVESLNSAIAGSILMRECYDRRLRRS